MFLDLAANVTFAIERPFPIDGLLFHDRLTEAWPTSLTFQWRLYRRPVKFSLPASADQGSFFRQWQNRRIILANRTAPKRKASHNNAGNSDAYHV